MPHYETMDRDKTLDPSDPWTRARAAHFAGNEVRARALRAEAEQRDAGRQSEGASSTGRGSGSGFLEYRPPTVLEPLDLDADRARLEEFSSRGKPSSPKLSRSRV